MNPKKRFGLSKKTALVTSIFILLTIGCLVIGIIVSQQHKSSDALKNATEQPQFSTVIPKGETVDTLGGWTRISPPNSDPVFAYNDTLANISINVSQQPLPKSFEGNVDSQVAELAKQYSATNQITAGSVKAYIGISSKGPQSVIFVKNNLLVLIKSQQKIDNKDWSSYIESLSE